MQQSPSPDQELAMDTVANRLTFLRMVLVPAVVWCLFKDTRDRNIAAAVLFGIAGITDYFDGYYARSHKAVTVMGQLMDPLADKFLVVSSLIMLQQLGRLHPIIVIILICRELAITGLRALASAEGIIIPASRLAKWKTITQMTAIPMLMLKDSLYGLPLKIPGDIFIYISILLSLWSLKDYLADFFRNLAEKRRQKKALKRAKKEEKRRLKRATRIKKFLKKNPEISLELQKALHTINDKDEDGNE